jgi:hypothetical protein
MCYDCLLIMTELSVATWNLNNRVGKVSFRPEAAEAAIALDVDLLVFTEFFPKEHEKSFTTTLANAGWSEQRMSEEAPSKDANRVLIASRSGLQLDPMPLDFPTFDLPLVDEQLRSKIASEFRSNIASVSLPGLSIIGVRVPWYKGKEAHFIVPAWEWLEKTTTSLKSSPVIVIGDMNVETTGKCSRGGDHFRRILDNNGWHRAEPGGPTFFGKRRASELDHILATNHCSLSDLVIVKKKQGFLFAGSSNNISDHAALVCRVELSSHKDVNQPARH